jgi:superfamily I DNA/RNA helicase
MLNDEQLAAVRHEGAHLLIVAGPGTGKTATIVERIRRLAERLNPAEKILAITFTNKAAREMTARLRGVGVDLTTQVEAGTFHAFSLQLLRRYQARLKFPLTFSIISPDEVEALAKDFWPGRSARERRAVLQKMADWKASLFVTTDDPDVNAFRQMMRAKALVDFDDILRDAVLLLREAPDIRAEVQAAYPFVFVDEYQDVSAVQVALLKELVTDRVRLTAIGDPHQAIYGFRGSDVRYFHSFGEMFQPAALLALSRNYRSGGDLVAAGSQVIDKGKRFSVTPVTAEINAKGLLKVHTCLTDKAEAEYVAHAIERLVGGVSHFSRNSGRVVDGEGGRSFNDIAVLYRLNMQGRLIKEALERLGVPCQVSGDRAAVLLPKTIAALTLSERFDNVREALLGLRRADPGLDENWKYFAAIADSVTTGQDFIDQLALQTPEDRYLAKAEKVSLMTLHAAKGLEFPVVFIVGCEEGLLPLHQEFFTSDLEEERRLFYVGMTRAKEELILLCARKRLLYGKSVELAPSRFLADITEDLKAYEQRKARTFKRSPEKDQFTLF